MLQSLLYLLLDLGQVTFHFLFSFFLLNIIRYLGFNKCCIANEPIPSWAEGDGEDELVTKFRKKYKLFKEALARYNMKTKKKGNNSKGFVINILDAKIFGLNPDYYTYTLSKQAMYGLTKMSALTYVSFLRVNGIAPGITLLAPGQDQKAFEKSHKKNLLKSSSTVEEILNAIQLIINTKSMTGHVTVLDGGAHLAPPRRDVGL